MHTLRVCEIKVDRKVICDLLFESRVEGIDSRVRVIFAEHAHTGAKRNSAARRDRNCVGPSRQLRCEPETCWSERSGASNAELLSAVVRDRANLRQHVLPTVVDAEARAP